ncbi:MAG: VWA domain-containing protein [candidate division KSB1 bacterium]|nr:VWA domain-containing protein [candidate division KSB1 bacterium]
MKNSQLAVFWSLLFLISASTATAQTYTTATDTSNIMILLDASGSMNEMIGEQSKMQLARRCLDRVLQSIPPFVRIGLRVYGHQSYRIAHDCQDSKLEVAPDYNTRTRIRNTLLGITPKGYTPLAYSLEEMEKDFPQGGKNFVICITDGKETCDGDPCAVAKYLRQSGLNVVIHVVGFRIGEADREILMCIPENSDGLYFSADDEDELEDALNQAVQASIRPGFIQLHFKALEEHKDFITASVKTNNKYPMYVKANTHYPVAVPPDTFRLKDFDMWSVFDVDPYCPDQIELSPIYVYEDSVTTVELDPYSILHVTVDVPDSQVIDAQLSFDRYDITYVPDLRIEQQSKWVLLQKGKYTITCRQTIHGEIKKKKKTVSLSSQGYQIIKFDFNPNYAWMRWLIIPGLLVIVIVSKLPTRKRDMDIMYKFMKNPKLFKGKKLIFSLRVDPEDLKLGAPVEFWNTFPYEIQLMINVPAHFRNIKEFDTRNPMRVTFVCNKGDLSTGNYMLNYRKARFYEI